MNRMLGGGTRVGGRGDGRARTGGEEAGLGTRRSSGNPWTGPGKENRGWGWAYAGPTRCCPARRTVPAVCSYHQLSTEPSGFSNQQLVETGPGLSRHQLCLL